MNFFSLLTLLAGIGAIASFLCGVRAMGRHGAVGFPRGSESPQWHGVFQAAVFVTILAAPLSS